MASIHQDDSIRLPDSPPIGKCQLCSCTRPLKNSHFLPKHIYRRYSEMAASGTSPMMAQQGKAFKVGKQLTQYLLCEKCEGKFSANGEDYFARVAVAKKGDRSPVFLFKVLHADLLSVWNRLKIASEVKLSMTSEFFPAIESDKIFYFVISMYWRAGLDGWRNYEKVVYEEALMEAMRNYLLNRCCIVGYVVRIVPSFWREKHGVMFPRNFQGCYYFSIGMFDFYLEKVTERAHAILSRRTIPITYTVDSLKSEAAYIKLSSLINQVDRARNLPQEGSLVSWGMNFSEN